MSALLGQVLKLPGGLIEVENAAISRLKADVFSCDISKSS